MEAQFSALYSRYIIDGVAQDNTPGGILQECMKGMTAKAQPGPGAYSAIADETVDLPPESLSSDSDSAEAYLSRIRETSGPDTSVSRYYPMTSTRLSIAEAIIETLWKDGSFRLGDLAVKASWKWDPGQIGNMAAFFYSATAAGEYLYDLGVGLEGFSFEEHPGKCEVELSVECVRDSGQGTPHNATDETMDDPLFCGSPFGSRNPHMTGGMKCSGTMVQDKGSWLIYIPFDTCPFKLGGSFLSKAMGKEGGAPAEIQDPDYFIDCYEVVRELTEDGIIMSGITSGRGGLMYAADRFCTDAGMSMDISGICMAYHENDPIRVLFGEVPGAIIQIRDNDYDYFDSQMLLQDVAYYPLGHPVPSGHGIELRKDTRPGISGILESLINIQASEGED
ncbi:MAG: hypothetical protein K2J62_11685 [Bacteroidales bacterium]|nr:hypothetical protein [Bacteroidales bacterium]